MKKTLFSLATIATLVVPQLASAARHCVNSPIGLGPNIICTDVPDPVPAPQCAVFYEHGGQGGAAWGVVKDSGATDISGAMIERRKWKGSLRGWKGSDRSWNDAISSVYVEPSCVLSLYTESDFNGSKSTFEGGLGGNVHGSVPFDDQYSSFECHCGGDIGGGYYHSTLP